MRKRLWGLALAALLVGVLAGCSGGGSGHRGNTDEDAIRNLYRTMQRALENEDINLYMSLFSRNYLDNGYTYADVRNEVSDLFYNFTDISENQDIRSLNVSGNYAYVTWTETIDARDRTTGQWKEAVTDFYDTLHFENGDWYLYGNQRMSATAIKTVPYRHSTQRLRAAPAKPVK